MFTAQTSAMSKGVNAESENPALVQSINKSLESNYFAQRKSTAPLGLRTVPKTSKSPSFVRNPISIEDEEMPKYSLGLDAILTTSSEPKTAASSNAPQAVSKPTEMGLLATTSIDALQRSTNCTSPVDGANSTDMNNTANIVIDSASSTNDSRSTEQTKTAEKNTDNQQEFDDMCADVLDAIDKQQNKDKEQNKTRPPTKMLIIDEAEEAEEAEEEEEEEEDPRRAAPRKPAAAYHNDETIHEVIQDKGEDIGYDSDPMQEEEEPTRSDEEFIDDSEATDYQRKRSDRKKKMAKKSNTGEILKRVPMTPTEKMKRQKRIEAIQKIQSKRSNRHAPKKTEHNEKENTGDIENHKKSQNLVDSDNKTRRIFQKKVEEEHIDPNLVKHHDKSHKPESPEKDKRERPISKINTAAVADKNIKENSSRDIEMEEKEDNSTTIVNQSEHRKGSDENESSDNRNDNDEPMADEEEEGEEDDDDEQDKHPNNRTATLRPSDTRSSSSSTPKTETAQEKEERSAVDKKRKKTNTTVPQPSKKTSKKEKRKASDISDDGEASDQDEMGDSGAAAADQEGESGNGIETRSLTKSEIETRNAFIKQQGFQTEFKENCDSCYKTSLPENQDDFLRLFKASDFVRKPAIRLASEFPCSKGNAKFFFAQRPKEPETPEEIDEFTKKFPKQLELKDFYIAYPLDEDECLNPNQPNRFLLNAKNLIVSGKNEMTKTIAGQFQLTPEDVNKYNEWLQLEQERQHKYKELANRAKSEGKTVRPYVSTPIFIELPASIIDQKSSAIRTLLSSTKFNRSLHALRGCIPDSVLYDRTVHRKAERIKAAERKKIKQQNKQTQETEQEDMGGEHDTNEQMSDTGTAEVTPKAEHPPSKKRRHDTGTEHQSKKKESSALSIPKFTDPSGKGINLSKDEAIKNAVNSPASGKNKKNSIDRNEDTSNSGSVPTTKDIVNKTVDKIDTASGAKANINRPQKTEKKQEQGIEAQLVLINNLEQMNIPDIFKKDSDTGEDSPVKVEKNSPIFHALRFVEMLGKNDKVMSIVKKPVINATKEGGILHPAGPWSEIAKNPPEGFMEKVLPSVYASFQYINSKIEPSLHECKDSIEKSKNLVQSLEKKIEEETSLRLQAQRDLEEAKKRLQQELDESHSKLKQMEVENKNLKRKIEEVSATAHSNGAAPSSSSTDQKTKKSKAATPTADNQSSLKTKDSSQETHSSDVGRKQNGNTPHAKSTAKNIRKATPSSKTPSTPITITVKKVNLEEETLPEDLFSDD